MSGRPSWKSAEIGLFRPFSAFFALFRRVRRAPGKSRKRRKKAFFLRYPQICLNPHLLNPHLRHPKNFWANLSCFFFGGLLSDFCSPTPISCRLSGYQLQQLSPPCSSCSSTMCLRDAHNNCNKGSHRHCGGLHQAQLKHHKNYATFPLSSRSMEPKCLSAHMYRGNSEERLGDHRVHTISNFHSGSPRQFRKLPQTFSTLS